MIPCNICIAMSIHWIGTSVLRTLILSTVYCNLHRTQHYSQPNVYSINVYILLLIIFHSYVKYIRFILAFVLCVPPNLLWCIDPVQFTLAAFNKIFFKYTRSSQVILDISTCQWQAQTNTN